MGEDEARLCAPARHGGSGEDANSEASLDPDRERRYAELFKQLDLNNDGRVDINELRTALAARGLHKGEAEEVRGMLWGRCTHTRTHAHGSHTWLQRTLSHSHRPCWYEGEISPLMFSEVHKFC